jgi:hypothetical protein
VLRPAAERRGADKAAPAEDKGGGDDEAPKKINDEMGPRLDEMTHHAPERHAATDHHPQTTHHAALRMGGSMRAAMHHEANRQVREARNRSSHDIGAA